MSEMIHWSDNFDSYEEFVAASSPGPLDFYAEETLPQTMAEKALQLALEFHAGQTDVYGNEYVEHLVRVADRVKAMEYTCVRETSEIDTYVAVAYLHDILEDTDATPEILEEKGFNEPFIIQAVDLLTRGEGVSYSDYIMSIKDCTFSAGAIARVVKLADLFDHLMGPTPCPPQLVSRYEKSLYTLYGTKD